MNAQEDQEMRLRADVPLKHGPVKFADHAQAWHDRQELLVEVGNLRALLVYFMTACKPDPQAEPPHFTRPQLQIVQELTEWIEDQRLKQERKKVAKAAVDMMGEPEAWSIKNMEDKT